jgi:hypothetical protein
MKCQNQGDRAEISQHFWLVRQKNKTKGCQEGDWHPADEVKPLSAGDAVRMIETQAAGEIVKMKSWM